MLKIYKDLTRVDVSMLLHVRLLMKSLATVLTRVGPCIRVYQEVSGQCRTSFERFPTLFAIKSLFAIMNRPKRKISFQGVELVDKKK